MSRSIGSPDYRDRLAQWLLKEERASKKHSQQPWWKVMCLTGVDYFSTLGYQPGIAALAAGALSPVATFILVLLTLFGALPIYRRVAANSPNGEGSIAMLEHLLANWKSKVLVLCLLGFVATDFIITITLSAADAAAHITENPFVPAIFDHQELPITLALVVLLGLVFLRGFHEAIGIAVALVAVFLLLNLVTLVVCLGQVWQQPQVIGDWRSLLFTQYHNPLQMVAISALLFPKLALGLSGFETGVAVMPLIQGSKAPAQPPTPVQTWPPDSPLPLPPTTAQADGVARKRGRIRNTYKLLTAAALIMSFYLLLSSVVTIWLIPAADFERGGAANGRALAYLAHRYLGDGFGTLYDLSTISILWFAGASAMAGLLNIVPRYLPRYGMAPDWARRVRPLVLVYTAIAIVVTVIFKADVDAQGGAYATGVLVLMSSAAFAVTLLARRQRKTKSFLAFCLITLLFFYTTIINVIERPEGLQIASFFIGAIVATSLISRVWRSTELRVERVEMDALARRFIAEANGEGVQIIANRLNTGDEQEYRQKEIEVREDNRLGTEVPIVFLEITVDDASEFADVVQVEGVQVGPYQILRAQASAVPNAIAAILLHIRDQTGTIPHAYFGWIEGNPIQYLLRFILFGEGDIAIVTREVLRKAERNPEQRPAIHVGG